MSQYSGHELEALKEAHNYYSWLIQEFNPFIKGKVLEVGAGAGTFSEYLLRLSIRELICLEPVPDLIPLSRLESNDEHIRVFSETLGQFGATNSEVFNSVVCVNVLEHIEDDQQALVDINRLLRTGGSLCLFVPAVPWLYGTLDESFGHYRRYSRTQLKELLTESGFEIHKLKYFNMTGILTWILMGKILRWRTWGRGSVSLYDQIVTPIISRIERIIPPHVGQSLIAIGMKKG
jgi:SAM-dependent methyltransferase